MKKNVVSAAIVAITLCMAPLSAAFADSVQPGPASPSQHGYSHHKHPPFPVVKRHILARMQNMQKTAPERMACVEKSENFRQLHACFPHRKWHHQNQGASK